MGRYTYSLDDTNIDYYSKIAAEQEYMEYSSTKDDFNNIENKDLLFRYLKHLSIIDSTFLMLSYMYRMSQTSISKFLDISQVGVSVRIKRAFEKIKFLLDCCPKLNYIDVREDFEKMFPPHLFEIAFFFYFNHTQSRTKYFLNITQCGAAFKLKVVLKHLENIIKNSKDDDLKFLANTYNNFFQVISKKSNTMNTFFRNDYKKNQKLIEGKSII